MERRPLLQHPLALAAGRAQSRPVVELWSNLDGSVVKLGWYCSQCSGQTWMDQWSNLDGPAVNLGWISGQTVRVADAARSRCRVHQQRVLHNCSSMESDDPQRAQTRFFGIFLVFQDFPGGYESGALLICGSVSRLSDPSRECLRALPAGRAQPRSAAWNR